MTFTRKQIESVKIGSVIAWGLGTEAPKNEYKVVEITTTREDIKGKLFVHGYFQFSRYSRMSFSIKEGNELDFKLYRIVE